MENYISNHHGDNKNVFSFPYIVHPKGYIVLVDALLCFGFALHGGVLHASMSTRIEGSSV
jgi:hypothetical protein